MFRSIVFSSVIAGVIVGVLITAIQMVGTTPLILQAETFESAGGGHSHGETSSDAAAPAEDAGHSHDHGEDAWAPAGGLERNVYTGAANVLTAIGYALVLTGLLSLRGSNGGWREGLLWGIAGFVAVMVAPMIGLPPELPGSPAADLVERQAWWIGTAAATAAGIALLAFRREPWAAVAAVVLIALPHVIGAPLPPDGVNALAPLSMERRFVTVATVTAFLFWAMLGALTGMLFSRFRQA